MRSKSATSTHWDVSVQVTVVDFQSGRGKSDLSQGLVDAKHRDLHLYTIRHNQITSSKGKPSLFRLSSVFGVHKARCAVRLLSVTCGGKNVNLWPPWKMVFRKNAHILLGFFRRGNFCLRPSTGRRWIMTSMVSQGTFE